MCAATCFGVIYAIFRELTPKFKTYNIIYYKLNQYYPTASLFEHCATSREVAGSISDGVFGIFLRHNPSGRTMTLGSTQPLTEVSTRNISLGVKAASAFGWQPYYLYMPTVLKYWSLNLLEPSGPVPCPGIALPLPLPLCHVLWPPYNTGTVRVLQHINIKLFNHD